MAETLARGARNPYETAKAIYDYMLSSYKIVNIPVMNEPLDMLNNGAGDAYDFAIIFTALCRKKGIPALPISGLFVDRLGNVKNHWWTEIFFENYGWFPVDASIGAGLNYLLPEEIENPKDFYFGSMDASHIAFSRGWKELKAASQKNIAHGKQKTFALQSVWEETEGSPSYSAFWNVPEVKIK